MKGNLGVIDLFSGCGGSALGFNQSGFPIKVAVDIDESASESFKANFPECVRRHSSCGGRSGGRL